jgi:hypothetical protein
MCLLGSMMLDKEMVGTSCSSSSAMRSSSPITRSSSTCCSSSLSRTAPSRDDVREELLKRSCWRKSAAIGYLADPQHRPRRLAGRALRGDRARKVHAAAAHRRQQRHPARRLRAARTGGRRAGQRRKAHLPHRREERSASRWKMEDVLHEVFEAIENKDRAAWRRDLRSRRHAQRPAERRDDRRGRPALDGQDRPGDEHHRAHRRRHASSPARSFRWK